MNRKTLALTVVFLIAGLTLTSCQDRITADEIITKVRNVLDTTEDAHAILTVSLNAQGIEMEATAEVWEKAPAMIRAEVATSTDGRFDGTIVVTDGQTGWVYEPGRHVVTVGDLGSVEMPLPQEILTSLQDAIQSILDVSDVTLVGEESVAGRAAYKLRLKSREDADVQVFPGGGTATLWVDKAQWFVLKASYDAGTFGRGEIEIQSFELNAGMPASLFEFHIPEGASVIETSSQEPIPLTLDEAIALAPFPLMVPSYVPDGVTLVGVFQASDSFVLRYDHSPLTAFTVIQGPELASHPPLGESQGVSVRGYTATAVTDSLGGNTFLYWTEEGVTITVAGHIGLADALKVAEGLR